MTPYSGQQTIPADYFLTEYHRFREIMCSTKYTSEEKDIAFQGFSFVYLNLDPKDPKTDECIVVFSALVDEFTRRKSYELLRELSYA